MQNSVLISHLSQACYMLRPSHPDLATLIIFCETYRLQSSSLCIFSSLPPHCVTFRNTLFFFYGEELLTPRPTPKLEDNPLSTVRYCLFTIFAATLHIWRPSRSYIRNRRTRHAMHRNGSLNCVIINL
jgi:hypothetical protein